MVSFVHGDFGGLSGATLESNALPYKVVATALLTGLLVWGARHVDWIGLPGWTRVGWLSLLLGGAAVIYFGSLLAMGLNLRQFVRRG